MARAILVNSRNANCATGSQGVEDARRCCRELARRLGCADEHVLMASTGPIGAPLPTAKVIDHLDQLLLASSPAGGMDFARAIMTTDTHPKAATTGGDPTAEARVTGFAKGSGMIHPNMATTLGVVCTDAVVAPSALQRLLHAACDTSFNAISVDGDTSTNDALIALASGATGCGVESPEAWRVFSAAVTEVLTTLARAVAADQEATAVDNDVFVGNTQV